MASSWLGNDYRGKTVLVTGASGFLGKFVCNRLFDAGAVIIHHNSTIRDLCAPINPLAMDNPEGVDLIIHLAAKVDGIVANSKYPFDFFWENCRMADTVVAWAINENIPIVAAGSVCVYSDTASFPFKEKDIFLDLPEETNIGYGMAKRYLLTLLQMAEKQVKLKYAYVCCANLYGPGDTSKHVIPDLIRKVMDSPNNDNQVQLLGSGETTRDFLYADDAADAYMRAGAHLLRGGPSLVFNAGSGKEVSIQTVLARICRALNMHPKVLYSSNNALLGQKRRIVDISKAYTYVGWQPSTSLEEGIFNTVQRAQQDAYAANRPQHNLV